MNTDQLIDRLSLAVAPLPSRARERRLSVGVVAGGVVTFVLVAAVLGIRPDLPAAASGFAFWMKLAYTASLAIGAFAATARLARPEPVRMRHYWPAALPFALLAVIGAAEMTRTPRHGWPAMWLGATWNVCPWLVLALTAPILAGLLWSFRRLAPTRLRAAGAAAGLTAGACAATLYCLHCPEASAVFVATWYTLGILLAGGAGALAGPRLLRW